MNQDNKVIAYLSPDELAAIMTETGMITVHESSAIDGKPVIHAALKVVNAQTGEQLPGGLPFSVVMFKNPREPGYTNIAIGTIVPAAELEISLPRDYFNFCNQRFRFTRVFPLDERSFVLQMDLFVRNATREYVKFSFGIWAAMFSQVLFELMGRGRESLVAAAEAYAVARTDLSQMYVSTQTASDETVPTDMAAETTPDCGPMSEPLPPEQVAEEVGQQPVADGANDGNTAEVLGAEAPAEPEGAEPATQAAGEEVAGSEAGSDTMHVSPDIAAASEGPKEAVVA